jgi:hypothetical protein
MMTDATASGMAAKGQGRASINGEETKLPSARRSRAGTIAVSDIISHPMER